MDDRTKEVIAELWQGIPEKNRRRLIVDAFREVAREVAEQRVPSVMEQMEGEIRTAASVMIKRVIEEKWGMIRRIAESEVRSRLDNLLGYRAARSMTVVFANEEQGS